VNPKYEQPEQAKIKMVHRKLQAIDLIELKACPFCGSESVEKVATDRMHLYSVWCFRCEAAGPNNADPQEAIRLWNQRAYEIGKAGLELRDQPVVPHSARLLLKVRHVSRLLLWFSNY
jgi:Lar family restriction alleviation protein